MQVIVSLLRGVNVGGHHKVKMEILRALYASLGLNDPRTYVQSGNVVFRTAAQDLEALARKIERAIESTFSFHSDVVLRTAPELRAVVETNPFAGRNDVHPAKLSVFFLGACPGPEAWDKVWAIPTGPEELRSARRELYVYFPDGMGRSKLPVTAIERALNTTSTARNWNTVTKLLSMAEEMESPDNR